MPFKNLAGTKFAKSAELWFSIYYMLKICIFQLFFQYFIKKDGIRQKLHAPMVAGGKTKIRQ